VPLVQRVDQPKKNSHALQQIGDGDRKLVGESQENETCGDSAAAADIAHPSPFGAETTKAKGHLVCT
jgi:hypothetical protein